MSTKAFTNDDGNTLFKKFQGILESRSELVSFDSLVGYFRSSGYFALRPYLEKIPHIRILVGINVDKLTARWHHRSLEGKRLEAKNLFLEEIKNDIRECRYDQKVERGILQFVEDITTGKITMRAYPHRRVHAKIYIFRPENFNEHHPGTMITGSSNFTEPGLGVRGNSSNYEFNVLVNDYDDIKFACDEFEKLWAKGIEILTEDVKEIPGNSYLKPGVTPFEVYMKFLITYFGKSIEYDPEAVTTDLPAGYRRLSYQIDAVNQGLYLLEKYNGFFLADVVGLGKTLVGALIARHYAHIFRNESMTLVVVPPALKSNWQETLLNFGLREHFHFELITNGSLHKVMDHKLRYGLVIVDEAHKFRNHETRGYEQLNHICKTPHISGERKKVILVSATPLNNQPLDIGNLVYLFQDKRVSTLEILNLEAYFLDKQKAYKDVYKYKYDAPEVYRKRVKDIYMDIREKIITPLTIRRTRSDLMEFEEYSRDLKEQNVVFPEIRPPRNLYYQLPPLVEVLYDKTLNILKDELQYNRYKAISFVKEEIRQADQISNQLAKLMKILLLKRLDSSFYAFKKSLERFKKNTEGMIRMFENDRIIIAPKYNVSSWILEDREEELIEKLEELKEGDESIRICKAQDFDEGFLTGLKKDHELLCYLWDGWKDIHKDPKLEVFTDNLNVLLSKKINPGKKLVLFSESKETTEYLLNELKKSGYKRIISVNSSNRKDVIEKVRLNFDANIPKEKMLDDIDIIITTEVLGEGINLHRSNIILNYDTPWNSTKLMQRVGRINRIGSLAKEIFIYNFLPAPRVEAEIELKKRAELKLQAFHTALGEDSQIFTDSEEISHFSLFDPELKANPDERLNLLMEVRKFKKENPKWFKRITKYPLKIRTGRKIPGNKSPHTLCYIKDNRRDGFLKISGSNIIELTFTEMAAALKTPGDGEGCTTGDFHYKDIEKGLSFFARQYIIREEKEKSVESSLSTRDKGVLKYLKKISKSLGEFTGLSDKEKELIKKAGDNIRKGRDDSVIKKINHQVQKVKGQNNIDLETQARELLDILNIYIDDEIQEEPASGNRDQGRAEIIFIETIEA